MREALAAANHDYILTGSGRPRPKAKRSGPRSGAGKPVLTKRRMWAIGGGALCLAALAGVAINALVLQKGRHPAPLFGHALAPAVKDAGAPLPAARPAEKPPEAAPAQAVPVQEKPAARPHAASAPEAEARPHDPISELLRGGGEGRVSEAAPSKTVLAAQKALVKLGFVLKADGVMGATTKQAVEKYERERGRASHGELTPAVLRRLSAESGIAIN